MACRITVYPTACAKSMSSSLEGCENTVSAMNDSPRSISLALVSAAIRAAAYAWAPGASGQRSLAISSAFTKELPGSSGARVSSMKVDLPAPLDPTTRSRRFTARRFGPPQCKRRSLLVFEHHSAAIGAVLHDLTVVVDRDGGDPARGQRLTVVCARQTLLDGRGDLGVEHDTLFHRQVAQGSVAG